jgi:hypothetical protein
MNAEQERREREEFEKVYKQFYGEAVTTMKQYPGWELLAHSHKEAMWQIYLERAKRADGKMKGLKHEFDLLKREVDGLRNSIVKRNGY